MVSRNKNSFILFFLFVVFFSSNGSTESQHLDRYGGWTGLKGTQTGVFHVEKINDRWWIITPEGNIFWSTGMYCVRFGGIPDSETKGRPYKDACIKKYGSEVEWARITRFRLREWGFNTIGDWSSESIFREPGFAYVDSIGVSRKLPNVIKAGSYGYFPDVFSDEFKDAVSQAMKEKFKNQPYLIDDPRLLGYFLADEPAWYGSKGRRGSLVDDFIALDASRAGKQKWVEFLKVKYGTIENLDKAWQKKYEGFDELLSISTIGDDEPIKKDKLEFLKIIALKFSGVLVESLREFDKYHMVLGTRPTRLYPEVLEGLGKNVDIFSLSQYGLNKGYKIDESFEKTIDDIYRYTKKPILLGVLISAQDTRLPFGIVRTQKDRGISYWRYLQRVASRPEIVGLHWFQYFDPPKKCYDPQAANWGLVTDQDEPYEDAVNLIKEANKLVYSYALGASDFVPDFDNVFGLKKEQVPDFSHNGKLKDMVVPILDGGFEQAGKYWKTQTWKGNSKVTFDPWVKHSGSRSLKIKGGDQPGWESVGVGIQNNPQFTLKPGYEYRLSVWIKLDGVEDSAFVRIKVRYGDGTDDIFSTEGIYGTQDWIYKEIIFSPRMENTVGYLAAQLVGRGTAWFDDVTLEMLSSGNGPN